MGPSVKTRVSRHFLRLSLSGGLLVFVVGGLAPCNLCCSPAAAQAGEADTEIQVADITSPVDPARIEGLQALASGAHPGVPIMSLLSVSLDDDSALNARERALRLERRKVLIALRAADRFKHRTAEEVAAMRDQLLAMDLERKVVALPAEVRGRLVELDAEDGEKPEKPAAAKEPEQPGSARAGTGATASDPAPGAQAKKPDDGSAGSEPRQQEPAPSGAGLGFFSFLGLMLASLLVLGLRDLAASFVAGVALKLRKPFKEGDRVEVAGFAGKIAQLGVVSTRLITARHEQVTVPNRLLLTQPRSMFHAGTPLAALDLDFYVDANQDVGAAKRILEQVLAETRGVDVPKGTSILVKQLLLESGTVIRLRVRAFVSSTRAEEIESELTERVLEGLRTGGVRAPSQLPSAPRTREPTEPFALG